MKNKKEKLVVILLVVGLIVATVSISYAAFRYTAAGSVLNQITTGSITMSYTESSNVISMTGALPTTDATGKVRLNEGEYFDFTVGSSITGTANINFEIAAQELDGNTIDGKYIKYYLTEVDSTGNETEVMAPTTYTEETSSNEYTGRPANMMSLYEGSMNASTTVKYRLRLYVDESYNPQGDGGNLVYKTRVNVYGLAGKVKDRIEFFNFTFTDGYYPSWDSGELQGNSEYCTSQFIDISEVSGGSVSIAGVTSDVNAICFYDADYTFISGNYTHTSMQIPAGAKYVRIGIPIDDKDTLKMTLISADRNNYVVDKNGNGDFYTINEALNHAYSVESKSNPITITINPGVYEEVLNIGSNHYISLVGTDRDECIVKDETALYNNVPLRISGECYVANLSFISTANKYQSSTGTGKEAWIADVKNGVTNPDWLGTIGSYAVHCDNASDDEETFKVSKFENCYMYSETLPAFGSGMQINQRIELVNCKLETNIDSEVANLNLGNAQGTLLCHGKFGANANTIDINQSILVEGCTIKTNVGKLVNMYPEHKDDMADITFIDNNFISDEELEQSEYVNFTFDIANITNESQGNNIDMFNKE